MHFEVVVTLENIFLCNIVSDNNIKKYRNKKIILCRLSYQKVCEQGKYTSPILCYSCTLV